jgi:quinoprotein dehydrogenase-associated probable ABC transporter substrate-binding protein
MTRNMTRDARLPRTASRLVLALVACAAAALVSSASARGAEAEAFRVCADPNNLPFSDRAGAGFENKLAEFIAGKLGQEVSYTWWAQRRGFIRNTLKAGACDVVMGIAANVDMVETTRPYYRSTYVFVSRSDRHYALSSLTDPRLHQLAIGVQLIGDDGANTPPAHALSEQGIVDNVVGYTVYGDHRQPSPPARIVEAVENGKIDVAAVWGPLAGYFAQRSPVALTVTPIAGTENFKPLVFQFDIAVGVRKGDHARRAQIDGVLAQHRAEITHLLESYGVPLVNAGPAAAVDHVR